MRFLTNPQGCGSMLRIEPHEAMPAAKFCYAKLCGDAGAILLWLETRGR
jgi:hypothetical protein